jgi:hypothetical protein
MKIKFIVKLTASPALLAVLSALAGLAAQEATNPKPTVVGVLGSEDKTRATLTSGEAEAPEVKVEAPKTTRTRSAGVSKPTTKESPAESPAPVEVAEKAETASEAIANEEQGAASFSLEDVQQQGLNVIRRSDASREGVKKLLASFSVEKISQLDPSVYTDFMKKLNEIA